MPGSRQTLEQHMAGLQAQNPALSGDSLLRPFPGQVDGQPCQVTAVLQRVAIVCMPDGTKHQFHQSLVTIDPADVRLSDSLRARQRIAERSAAARGRNQGLRSPLRQAGKGARQAAERAEEARNAG